MTKDRNDANHNPVDDEREHAAADADELGSGPVEMGIGLDAEGAAGTGEHNRGTGLDYDYEERRIAQGGEGEETVERERRETGM